MKYHGVALDRNNPSVKTVLEKLALDDQVWQSKEFQQWKLEVAYWLLENFDNVDRLTREQLLIRLSRETVPVVKQCALRLILTYCIHLDSSLLSTLILTILEDDSGLCLTRREAAELVCLAEQLPSSLHGRFVKAIMAEPIMAEPIKDEAFGGVPPIEGHKSIREWWHKILTHYDRYPSYAMFLALPSDKEAIRYLKEFGKELHLITGKSCLVITLTSLGFMQYGSGDEFMPLAVDEHIVEGYCLQASRLFSIGFDEFPCLLLFRDIRKPQHIRISLKGLSAEEIAQEMRGIFTVLDKSVGQGEDPIEVIDKHIRQQAVSEKGKSLWKGIQSFAGKTLETMMEVFVRASIK